MKLSSFLWTAYVSIAYGDIWPNYTDVTTDNICVDLLDAPANATGVQNATLFNSNNGLGLWRVAVSTKFEETTIEENPPLTSSSPGAVANIWLDPFTDVELTNGRNGYSACGYIFKELPYNTMLRGQHDDTSCEQMLSNECIEAITWRAAETAWWLVAHPTQGPYSNLTPPILYPICQDILDGIGYGPAPQTNLFPSECIPFFERTGAHNYPMTDIFPITSNETTPPDCTLQEGYMNNIEPFPFHFPAGMRHPFNATNGSAAASYDALVDQVWPILTVVFPPANVSREASVSAYATMTCIRAGKNIKADSRVPAALPAPTSVHFSSHLSKGAIAGVVIGSVLGAAILAGIIWWLWKNHRKPSGRSGGGDAVEKDSSLVEEEQSSVYHLDGTGATAQLDSKEATAQLDSTQRAELRGQDGGHELKGSSVEPQELAGSIPSPSVTKTDHSATHV